MLFNIANKLHEESGLVEYSIPEHFMEFKTNTLDYYYEDQYWLDNTGQFYGTAGIDIIHLRHGKLQKVVILELQVLIGALKITLI